MSSENHNSALNMPLLLALLPIILLIALLGTNVYFFEDDSSYGSNQMALLIAALVAGGIGMYRGISWSSIRDAISSNISQATEAPTVADMTFGLQGEMRTEIGASQQIWVLL